MTQIVIKNIIDKVTSVPGVIALSNINLKNKPVLLNKTKHLEAFVFEENDNSIEISLAFILGLYVNAKVVATNLTLIIERELQKHKLILKKVNIYIRGVN